MAYGKGNNKKSTGKSSFGAKKSNGGKNPTSKKEGFSKPKSFDKKPKPIKSLETEDIRLNKYISNSGVCSRRDADIYIQSGNVKVNGEVITEMGYKVKPTDVVNFDGVVVIPEKKE